MKRLLAISVVLNVVLVAGLLMQTEPIADVHADGAKCAAATGDANGDGQTDMSDAVHILSSLFTGGPDPVPLCSRGLPATGQSEEYYPGDDGTYEAGCPNAGRLVDNGDGTVTDNCTGLMWERAPATDGYYWRQAIDYCERLTLGGHEDWRLPNLRELQSIVDYGRYGPVLDPIFVTDTEWYWSSSCFVDSPNFAWSIDFLNGNVTAYDGETWRWLVRAVRSGP